MKVIGVFLIAQVIDGWLVQPFVLGPSVDTHPLELFVLLLAAATIGGITAMAVALPAYVILRIIFGEVWPLISKRD
jgi:predicted PurR-regulated permease PerM